MNILMNIRIMIMAAMLSATLGASAQNAREEIRANKQKAGGVYYMYQFDPLRLTPAPRGFKPVYISHYGRHGARNILHESQYDTVYHVLRRAAADRQLTERGQSLWTTVEGLYPLLHRRAGDLTQKGSAQHRQLATRMFSTYPDIFGKHPQVKAYSSTVTRCIVSMSSFGEQLARLDPKLRISYEVSNANMHWLNGYSDAGGLSTRADADFKRKGKTYMPAYRKFAAERFDTKAFARRIFRTPDYLESHADAMRFCMDLFIWAVDMQCTDLPDPDMYQYFTDDELFGLWECDNYLFYVQRGPDQRNRGRSRYLSTEMLRDILDKAEADLGNLGECSVRLRFGHDGCMMGLFNLMQLGQWGKATDNPEEIKDFWRTYDIPMASNMHWVFYRNSTGETLVKILYNEREISLPLASDTAPYYNWATVRDHYRKVLASTPEWDD